MGARFSAPVQTGPGAHAASCMMGTGSFPGGRGVTLTPHSLLMPWSRKSRAIPLLLLWAVRPVQSLSACTRAHFTLLYPLKTIERIARVRHVTKGRDEVKQIMWQSTKPIYNTRFLDLPDAEHCVILWQSTKAYI